MKESTKGLLKTESDSEYERSINGSPAKMVPVTGESCNDELGTYE